MFDQGWWCNRFGQHFKEACHLPFFLPSFLFAKRSLDILCGMAETIEHLVPNQHYLSCVFALKESELSITQHLPVSEMTFSSSGSSKCSPFFCILRRYPNVTLCVNENHSQLELFRIPLNSSFQCIDLGRSTSKIESGKSKKKKKVQNLSSN